MTAIGALCALSACGSSAVQDNTAPPPNYVLPVEKGSNNTSFSQTDGSNPVFYNNRTVSSTSDTKDQTINTQFAHLYQRAVNNQPSGSQLDNGTVLTVRANSGKTHAFVFGNTSSGPLFTQYGRTTDVLIPTFGTATYSGGYTGLLKRGAASSGSIGSVKVLGDISLDVDFASSDVSGSISNRVSSLSGTRFEDVTLAGTVDGNGEIAGTAIGGRPLWTSSFNRGSRSFGAVIGKEDASQIAGYVRNDWSTGTPSSPTGEYHEAGAFLANKDP